MSKSIWIVCDRKTKKPLRMFQMESKKIREFVIKNFKFYTLVEYIPKLAERKKE